MSDQGWYIANEGQSVGPMTREALIGMLDQYQGAQTLVFGPNTGEWVQAGQVSGLAGGG